jgi:hypothetical protein
LEKILSRGCTQFSCWDWKAIWEKVPFVNGASDFGSLK